MLRDEAGRLAKPQSVARTPEGLERIRRAHFKHGHYAAGAIALRRYIRQLLADSRETLKEAAG